MDIFEVIKEKVGGKLSDEQIMEITQKVDVNEQVEVVVIDNPIEFEKKIRNRNEEHYIDNVQEFGYIGSKKSNRNVNSKVLLGDAEPGICSITENIDHGSEYTEEEFSSRIQPQEQTVCSGGASGQGSGRPAVGAGL